MISLGTYGGWSAYLGFLFHFPFLPADYGEELLMIALFLALY